MTDYLFEETMNKLQKLWEDKESLFTKTHIRERGMRSSQLAALVYALIEIGVIRHDNVDDIKSRD